MSNSKSSRFQNDLTHPLEAEGARFEACGDGDDVCISARVNDNTKHSSIKVFFNQNDAFSHPCEEEEKSCSQLGLPLMS